ncbi:NAD-dependent epimerase/dehydratase family protein [Rhizobium paknamense]|uniref:dTDP-6-deoxy-L-talose 4-dehydrogenase (NAD+) n=1 Tax=Rhizobium paknamense TaxID=1206817 RepID=A0ABU0IFB5_9HYPH|nr:NAD(P)-dependent oxidoreductase [Rhizobium paknamense]MDQ0456940.1 dTDP-6-deoxy-L-talose 4-dehydrogenase (NAD+) [Rhizobium paknamense]
MAKRILLTGATGFVGRQIHLSLIEAGHEVVAPLRLGGIDRLKEAGTPAHIIATDDLFDLSPQIWAEHCQGIDAVIHAAWYVNPVDYLDSPENFRCVAGTMALAEGAARAGVAHFIGVGTCAEYRWPSERLTVDDPLEPRTLYAAAKIGCFHMLQQFFKAKALPFSWCRIFYLFGEGEHPRRLVPYVRQKLQAGEVAKLSKGTQLRDFLDVREAGSMIAGVVDTGQEGAINICSGQAITIRAFVEKIADEYGRRDLLEFGTADIHPSDPLAVVGVCNVARA